eukprot:1068306-Rhodomonas_salina.1
MRYCTRLCCCRIRVLTFGYAAVPDSGTNLWLCCYQKKWRPPYTYGATLRVKVRTPYAMSGTDLGLCHALSGTVLGHSATGCMVLRFSFMVLRLSYAVSGTDCAYAHSRRSMVAP